MVKKITILAISLLISTLVYSQRWKLTRYEAIIGIGTVNYFGDIGGGADRSNLFGLKDVFSLNTIKNTRPTFYLGARYKLKQNQSVKLNIVYGFIQGDDKGSVNDSRGYSFSTHLIETSAQFEYSFIDEDRRRYSFALFNRRGMMNNYSKINIYSFAGLGGIVFFPTFKGNANPAYESTSGYSKIALVVPVGVGFKLIYNNRYAFGFEFGGRWTTTDYLEGFNATQFSHHNDIYYFGVVNLVYRIKTSRRGYPILFRRW